MTGQLSRWFELDARGSTVGRELRGAVATFLTMAYILFVNPQVLRGSAMPKDVADSLVACTAAAAGSVSAGVHQVCVIFQTRQGYLTKPSPATTWTASGGKRAVVTNIPTGPANIVGRILCFTGAGGASFFYTGSGSTLFSGNMVISDNATTSLTVDFSDAILLAGTNVDDLFKLIELSDCAGVLDYAQRLFWWGERNKQNNWLNLGFDGGFTGPSLPHYPLGWTPDAVFAPGGTDEENFVVWGAAYSIAGNGTTATRGLITQPAVTDSLGAPLIQANTDYTVRARCARNALLSQGTLHIHLFSTSGGINTTGLQLTAAQLTTGYVEYSAQLTAPLATIPGALVLRVYADGTPNQNGQFYIDCLEIFPTAQPVNASLVRTAPGCTFSTVASRSRSLRKFSPLGTKSIGSTAIRFGSPWTPKSAASLWALRSAPPLRQTKFSCWIIATSTMRKKSPRARRSTSPPAVARRPPTKRASGLRGPLRQIPAPSSSAPTAPQSLRWAVARRESAEAAPLGKSISSATRSSPTTEPRFPATTPHTFSRSGPSNRPSSR